MTDDEAHSEIRIDLSRLHSDVSSIILTVGELEAGLFRRGNGRPPLMERVANIEAHLVTIEQSLRERRTEYRQIRIAVTVATMALFGQFAQLWWS